MNTWVSQAIEKIEADFTRSADTHLLKVELPMFDNIHLYLKDESTHPSGSLKHRLARSLFLYGLCNGHIKEGTSIVESSSGNTAISEAYFSQLLNLPFIAVVPEGTSQRKLDQIAFYDGKYEFAKSHQIYAHAEKLAKELDGHYMDQFTFAERATDWRGNNNIAQSIFAQLECEPFPEPTWIVVSAGTGGTSATIGRYLRYTCQNTKLCVADPENSVFYDYYHGDDASITLGKGSFIEGIGRPRVEPSFLSGVIDRMIKVPDAASFATLHYMLSKINKRCGGSTGTNLFAAFQLMAEMHEKGQTGSVVSMLCDSGERYLDSYFDLNWLKENNFDLEPYTKRLETFYTSGELEG